MHKPSPSKYFLRFFRWFCDPDLHPYIEGDLLELYRERVEKLGKKRADRKFARDVILLFRPGLIRKVALLNNTNTLGMFRHNLLISWRGFKKDKTTFLINLIGLSAGLACALLIYLWVADEYRIDKFHEKGGQLFQVMKNVQFPDGIRTENGSPALLAKALMAEMPEVEQAITIGNEEFAPTGILSIEDTHVEASGMFAGQGFFQLFTYPLSMGNSNQVLLQKNAIVLSETLAGKLFGSPENSMGKTLEGNADLFEENYTVTGVFKDTPYYSTMQFDFIINYETVFDKVSWINEWTGDGAQTFVSLKQGTDLERFNSKLAEFIQSKPHRQNNALFVQPYAERYLYGQYENGAQAGGRIAYVRLFSLVACFILLIAAINFMNLSTARASRKMKEVGVKKAMGVNRSSLIVQFLGESMFTTILAFLLAILAAALILPQVNEFTGKQLQFNIDTGLAAAVSGIVILVGLLSGVYPAFYLSGFKAINVLKGGLNTSFSAIWARKSLVVLQFVVSGIFIVGFLIINKQIEYLQTADLGYNRENVIHFSMSGDYDRATFLTELKNIPGVVNATNLHGGSVVEMRGSGTGFSWSGQAADKKILFQRPQVGYDFIETLGIEVIEGRSFSSAYRDETSKLIINQAAAELIGQDDIVGRTIMDGDKEKQVIGIVQDFNIKSLRESMLPCIMRFSPAGSDFMIKLNAQNERTTLAQIEALYDRFQTVYPMEFTFLDEEYQSLYTAENSIAVLSRYFTMMAILISCLGLFGLAAFAVEQRTKEVGIRKVLGAGVFGLVRLLSADFTKMVSVAVVISLPITYLISRYWLNGFAYHVDLQWWFFLAPALLILLIAWGTVGLHTVRAALVNPVEILKRE